MSLNQQQGTTNEVIGSQQWSDNGMMGDSYSNQIQEEIQYVFMIVGMTKW